ncbi:MAG TPA: helix-turn-helix domain-containing protein [Acidothermaceae bacterium]|jgi:sugar-specific transcriptional regulator TrmB
MTDFETQPLVELGLTGYEASAYLALIRRGQATGAEVARIAGLPRQRIYDVLGGLVTRGLATVAPGRPAQYTATAPDAAFEQLLEQERARLIRLERDIATTVAQLTPAYHAGRSVNDPLNFIEVLRDPAAIAVRFAEYEALAEHEILVFTKPPYAVEPAENVGGLGLLKRNIEARSIYERSIYEHPAHHRAVRKFVAAGEQARVVDELPLKLVVIDERVALFTMEDPVAGTADLTIMIVEHRALASLLKTAFEAVWASGEAFV